MACTIFKTGHHANLNKRFAWGDVDLKENKGKREIIWHVRTATPKLQMSS